MRSARALIALLLLLLALPAQAEKLTLWHSYRGKEKSTLEGLIKGWNAAQPDKAITPLAIPNDAFFKKLESAIPQGHGPDLFIGAHDKVGAMSDMGLLLPIGDQVSAEEIAALHPKTVDALSYGGERYGLPLAAKSVALFYRTDAPALADGPPRTTDALISLARGLTEPAKRRFGLAYEAGNFYFHAAWLFGFGGRLFDDAGAVDLGSEGNLASLRFARRLLLEERIMPEEADAQLVNQLFNSGLAPMVINGPWFLGEIKEGVPFAVTSLPTVSETGKAASPFLTVEGVLFPKGRARLDDALAFARYLLAPQQAITRAVEGRQIVATTAAFDDPRLSGDAVLMGFRAQMDASTVMDNRPAMSMVWEPMRLGLARLLRGSDTPEEALRFAVDRHRILSRPAPAAASPLPYALILGFALLAGAVWSVRRARQIRLVDAVRANRHAYAYLAPAFMGLALVLFLPFIVGTTIALFSHRGGDFTFVGLSNFWSILSSSDYPITSSFSMYFTLAVTILWTATNVFLHVSIGLGLALILRHQWIKMKGIYRVLLIVPWAVPNYITALIWRRMFDKQFGALNAMLDLIGLEPVSWFSQFWTAFTANLVTNTWLGFPFMMVVTLGALQSIPRDLEEAAEIDGASKWQRFRFVILPLLKPALLPAVILGSVWTFNMFNIIYLVSKGEPNGGTEILITEAYKWAFERQYQYGYAAAYATVIFVILLMYTALTNRLMRSKGGAA